MSRRPNALCDKGHVSTIIQRTSVPRVERRWIPFYNVHGGLVAVAGASSTHGPVAALRPPSFNPDRSLSMRSCVQPRCTTNLTPESHVGVPRLTGRSDTIPDPRTLIQRLHFVQPSSSGQGLHKKLRECNDPKGSTQHQARTRSQVMSIIRMARVPFRSTNHDARTKRSLSSRCTNMSLALCNPDQPPRTKDLDCRAIVPPPKPLDNPQEDPSLEA